jgi:hypothetical protein
VLNGRGILIVNLAKGSIGAEPANLMGSLAVAMIQAAAMARSEQAEADRAPFHLIIDEFAYVMTSAFVDILAEARKYRLALTLAHQHLAQIDEQVQAAVLANAGSVVAFRVGAEDAPFIARAIGDIAPTMLIDLSRGRAWMRTSPPASIPIAHYIQTFTPLEGSVRRFERVSRLAHERATRPRRVVEENIEAWFGQ